MAVEMSPSRNETMFEGGYLVQNGTALEVCLETKDLKLCSVTQQDKPAYQALYSDPDTMKMFTDNEERLANMDLEVWKREQMTNVAQKIDVWIQRWKEGVPFSAFAIYHHGEFVGHIVAGMGDNPGESEIAYIISHKHWNKGFASQAVEAVVQKWLPYLHQQGYKTGDGNTIISVICATSRRDNAWSNRILIKNGFTKMSQKETWGCLRNIYQKEILDT